MIVAQLRGVEFFGNPPEPDSYEDWDIICKVFDDIVQWLNFRQIEDYTEALPKLGKKIFLRATY